MSLSKIVALARLARLHFLVGTGIAYLVGALMARHETGAWNWTAFGVGLLVVWSVQLTAQFFNEYYDQPTDSANRYRTPFSGGSGVLVAGQLRPAAALFLGCTTLVLGAVILLGFPTLPTFGTASVVIFGIALIGAVGYSVPSLAFANRGWGELDTAIIGALLTPLFGYNLQTGRVSLTLILACLPFAMLIFANMLNVAFPDYDADRTTGKRTLVVILGPHRAARLYSILLVAGYVAPWLTLGWGLPLIVLMTEAATLPLGLLSLREVRRGGYRTPERFGRNTLLGVSAVIAIGLAEVVGFLLVGSLSAIGA